MGNYTENLNLYNTDMTSDGDHYFDFDRDINQNNNILDAAIGKLSTLTTEQKTSLVAAINELVAGKSSVDLDNLSSIGQAIIDKKVEVEALLQQNGYAKFSWKENNQISNLLIQWGRATTQYYGYNTATLPIIFNKVYSIIGDLICSNWDITTPTRHYVYFTNDINVSIITFKSHDDYGKPHCFYIAIGY